MLFRSRRQVRDLILELKREGRTVFFSTHILPDAETLCDRMAVLSRGRLQGIGAVDELISVEVQGVEIVFELPADGSPPASGKITRTGDRYRMEVPEGEVYEALERLRGMKARLVGVSRIRPTLEDYFFALLENPRLEGR